MFWVGVVLADCAAPPRFERLSHILNREPVQFLWGNQNPAPDTTYPDTPLCNEVVKSSEAEGQLVRGCFAVVQ